MALQKTEAVVLKAHSWAESSRTVVFFTRDFGRLALVDKGGRRINSKRGRLIPFSQMEITFYSSEKESSGYISEVTLVRSFCLASEGSLGRLAYASAGCELLNILLGDQENQEDLYTYFISFLALLEQAPRSSLPAIFVTFYLHMLAYLGYQPALAACVSCGRESDEILAAGCETAFSVERGGVVCKTCQRSEECYIQFPLEYYRLLLVMQRSPLAQVSGLSLSYRQTTRLLGALTQLVSCQSGTDVELKSLEFLEKLKNSNSMP